MKFTLNGLEVTCTPQEFNELRGLGTITAEHTSVSTQSVSDACKAAGIPLEKTECNIDWSKVAIWPPRNEGPGTKFPPVPKGSDGEGVTLDKIAPNPDASKPEDVAAQRLIDSPKFQWGLDDIGRLRQSELPKSPDVNDAIALAKDYKPIKDGYVFVYAVADRDKSRVCEYYLKGILGDTYTTELEYALQYNDPDKAFDYVATHPEKNLCVVRVKVPASE